MSEQSSQIESVSLTRRHVVILVGTVGIAALLISGLMFQVGTSLFTGLILALLGVALLGNPLRLISEWRELLQIFNQVAQSRERTGSISVIVISLLASFSTLSYVTYRLTVNDAPLLPGDPLTPFIIGFAILGPAALLAPRIAPPIRVQAGKLLEGLAICPFRTVIGVILLWLSAEANGDLLGLAIFGQMTSDLQLVAFLLGIFSLAWGLSGSCQTSLGVNPREWRWREIAVVAAVTLLGFVLRVWNLEGGLRWFVDEVNFAIPALTASERTNLDIFTNFSSIAAFPWLYPYLQGIGVEYLGRNLVSLRLISALFGTMAIPGLYLLLRNLIDRHTAFIGALLFATFAPHIHWSRLAMNNIADPTMAIFAFAFLIMGLRSQRQRDFVIAGVFLGLTQYFYEGGRLFFPILAASTIGAYAVLFRSHKLWVRFALFVVAALLVAMPVYYTILTTGTALTPRMNIASTGGEAWYESVISLITDGDQSRNTTTQARIALSLLFYRPDGSLYYGGETPLLLTFMIPFFLLGVAYLLWRPLSAPSILLLLWIGGNVAANAIVRDANHSSRFVILFPALIAVVAIALRFLLPYILPLHRLRLLPTSLGRLSRRTFVLQRSALVLGAVAVVFAVTQVGYYWFIHMPLYRDQIRPDVLPDYTDALYRARDFAPGTHVHLISRFQINGADVAGILGFLAEATYRIQVTTADQIDDDYLMALDSNADQVFLVERGLDEVIAKLEQYYDLPEPQTSSIRSTPEGEDMLLYFIDAQPEAAAASSR